MTTPNMPLLWQTLETIQSHPENWRQDVYGTAIPDCLPEGNVCGTAFCFAGTALMLSGYHYEQRQYGRFIAPDGQAVYPLDAARELLGLDWPTTRHLFHVDNTLDDLQRIVKDIDESVGAA